MPGGRLARRYSLKLPLAAYSTSTYRGPAGKGASEGPLPAPPPPRPHPGPAPRRPRRPPACVQAPSRLMMFLCFPIIFIISISDTRSERSLSVASSAWRGRAQHITQHGRSQARPTSQCHSPPSPFNIFTATVTGLVARSLSMPMASAMTTWPKQPSPRGFPRVSLEAEAETMSTPATHSPVPGSLGGSVPPPPGSPPHLPPQTCS